MPPENVSSYSTSGVVTNQCQLFIDRGCRCVSIACAVGLLSLAYTRLEATHDVAFAAFAYYILAIASTAIIMLSITRFAVIVVLATGFSVVIYTAIEACSHVEFSLFGGIALLGGLLLSFAGAGIETHLAPLR